MIVLLFGIVLAVAWLWWMASGRKQSDEIAAELQSMKEPEVELDAFIARHHFADAQPAASETLRPEDDPVPPETQVMTWLSDHGVLPAQTQSQSQAQTTPVERAVDPPSPPAPAAGAAEDSETADIRDELEFVPIAPLPPLQPLAPLPPLPPMNAHDEVDEDAR